MSDAPDVDPALEAAYDTARTASRPVPEYLERFAAASARARAELAFRTVRYGAAEPEAVDLVAAGAGAPVVVFVHGGYWRRMTRADFAFVAPPLVRAGVSVALVGYPLAPAAGLDAIVGAVRRGTARAVEELGGASATRVTLAGHSVGAQLAAMTAAELPVHGLAGVSGLYDLAPLRRTTINREIAMDAATAARNAPVGHPPARAGALLLAVGGRESDAFHAQTARYADAWRGWGGTVATVEAARDDHFSIALALGDATSELARALVRLATSG